MAMDPATVRRTIDATNLYGSAFNVLEYVRRPGPCGPAVASGRTLFLHPACVAVEDGPNGARILVDHSPTCRCYVPTAEPTS